MRKDTLTSLDGLELASSPFSPEFAASDSCRQHAPRQRALHQILAWARRVRAERRRRKGEYRTRESATGAGKTRGATEEQDCATILLLGAT